MISRARLWPDLPGLFCLDVGSRAPLDGAPSGSQPKVAEHGDARRAPGRIIARGCAGSCRRLYGAFIQRQVRSTMRSRFYRAPSPSQHVSSGRRLRSCRAEALVLAQGVPAPLRVLPARRGVPGRRMVAGDESSHGKRAQLGLLRRSGPDSRCSPSSPGGTSSTKIPRPIEPGSNGRPNGTTISLPLRATSHLTVR